MRVARVELRRVPQLRPGGGRPARRAHGDLRAQRRRQDEPAGGRLLRLHGAARRAPPTSASWCARGASVARVALDLVDADGAHRLEVGFEPGEAKRIAPRRQPARRPARPRRAAAGERLPARAAGAGQGGAGGPPGPSRPAGGGAVAGARRHAGRVLARPGAAERAARARSRAGAAARRRPRRLGPRAGAPGTAAHGGPPRGRGRPARRSSPSWPGGSGCPATAELRYRPRSPAADAGGAGGRSSSERRAADIERGFTVARPASRRAPAPARRGRAALVRVAGPAAQSRCWRSCSPSARSWRSAAAARR